MRLEVVRPPFGDGKVNTETVISRRKGWIKPDSDRPLIGIGRPPKQASAIQR